MTDRTAYSYPGIPPRQVAGFAQAAAHGLLPVTPSTAPALVPGRTAGQEAQRWALRAAVSFFGAIAVFALVQSLHLPPVVAIAVVVPILAFALLSVMLTLGRVGERHLAELQRGYTTLQVTAGTFWFTTRRRFPGIGHHIPWDYSGVWVYDTPGRTVRSAPTAAVVAPGFYPSPSDPDRLELWTGMVWTGQYRDYPASYPRPFTA